MDCSLPAGTPGPGASTGSMRASARLPNANSLTDLWPDQKAHGPFGDLTAHCAQDLTKAWSAAFFETTRRKKAGEKARLPLKKRYVVPITWRKGEFRLRPATDHTRARVELSTRRGTDSLVLALSHDHPYDPSLVRSVRLFAEGGDVFCDITSWVAVVPVKTTRGLIAGVDPGIIHPLAVACGNTALLVSGRASRAEEFLHLETKRPAIRRCRPKGPRNAHGPGLRARQASGRGASCTFANSKPRQRAAG